MIRVLILDKRAEVLFYIVLTICMRISGRTIHPVSLTTLTFMSLHFK
jgi:hypothetical protein